MSATVRTLIVDDEPRARRAVELLLNGVGGFEIVGQAGGGAAAVAMINELRPDLVILDVQMPEVDGFAVLARLGAEVMPAVIFVTAFDQYALRAFDVHAVDYVLKPVEDERFHEALEHVRSRILARRATESQSRLVQLLDSLRGDGRLPVVDGFVATGSSVAHERERNERVVLKDGTELILVRPDEIDWVEADGDYMLFHVGGKTIMHRETMGSLETRLDPLRFRRIHRSTIVNLDRVVRLAPSAAGEHVVVLKDGTKLRTSRGYQDRLQEWLREVR